MDSEEDSLSISNDEFEGSFDEGSSDESESESEEVTSKKQYQSHKRFLLTHRTLFGDSDSDSDDEATAYLEAKSMQLKKKREKEQAEAEAEDADIAEGAMEGIDEEYVWRIPNPKELKREEEQGRNLSDIKERITTVVNILGDFKNLRYKNTPRSAYMSLLQKDLSFYYGYLPILIEKFLNLFPPAEAVEFLEANETQRPVTIRTNVLKTRRKDLTLALKKRGVNLDIIEWSKDGIQVFDSNVPVGATPEYLSGQYMIQSASSWLPVIALDPQPNEKIMDMAAAPGGKTTHIAALMKNTGELYANDATKDRIPSLIANLHRMGVNNCIVTNYDGQIMKEHVRGFDRILLDAPCTGLGVVSKDPSVKIKRDEQELLKLAYLQKKLLLSAIDAVNHNSPTGGIIVYSTCSISVEENEWVVDYALKKRNVVLVDTGLVFGKPGLTKSGNLRFHDSLKKTRRFYPHTYNMDGFYVAKFRKLSDKTKEELKGEQIQDEDEKTIKPKKKKVHLQTEEEEDEWETVQDDEVSKNNDQLKPKTKSNKEKNVIVDKKKSKKEVKDEIEGKNKRKQNPSDHINDNNNALSSKKLKQDPEISTKSANNNNNNNNNNNHNNNNKTKPKNKQTKK